MQSAMSDLFFDAMQGKLGDLATSFKRTIDRMVSELIASQLLNFLTGDFGRTGELGGIVGDLFGGIVGRYTGGPVTQNSPYLVGERGPELFVPSTSGRVIDANTTRSMGGGVTVQNNFTIQGTMDTRTQAQISSMVGMSVNRAMARNT
jgi:phage-related minor tail protein